MQNSVSEQSFYIESEDEDEEKAYNKEGGDDGNDSDSSDASSVGSRQKNRPSSYNPSWPQSYRQSMDMYSSVASPNIGFLGTPTLSRLSSSFLSSSLTRRRTPEILSNLIKPLLPTVADEQIQQQRRSSHSLLPPPIPTKKPSLKKLTADQKPHKVSHELPVARHCSYGQTVLNGKSPLSSPYPNSNYTYKLLCCR
uniref:Uncharacterized protein n=1 Tax=Nelumbo nucifera TaxID=4432 RepID=A0A822Y7Q1_NELNU|nr:TPA_asm: hypothetical protein HUJ06_029998 [Nelumbo nucifera]